METTARKRALSSTQFATDASNSKRQAVEPGSLDTIVKEVEKETFKSKTIAPGVQDEATESKSDVSMKPDEALKKAASSEEEESSPEEEAVPNPGLPEYAYIVQSTSYEHWDDYDKEVSMEGVFLTLQDANNRVRNHCRENADRDDPDQDLDEGFDKNGCIWYKYRVRDESDGSGCEVQVFKVPLTAPGSEPVRFWGRDIGSPCPQNVEYFSDCVTFGFGEDNYDESSGSSDLGE